EEWAQDLRLVDDMLWVLIPRSGAEERSRLATLLPALIFRMKLAFLRAEIDPALAAGRIERPRTPLASPAADPSPRTITPRRCTARPARRSSASGAAVGSSSGSRTARHA